MREFGLIYIKTPNNEVLNFLGIKEVEFYFKNLNDDLNLNGNKRIAGRGLLERGCSKGYTLLNNVVFINGVWDVLHAGHFGFLNYCYKFKKDNKLKLYVGIDCDEKVKKDKGSERPIFSLNERIDMLSSLEYYSSSSIFKKHKGIDEIIPFRSNDELENIIKDVKPYAMIKDESWRNNVIGHKHVGKLFFYKKSIDISTSLIIERVNEKNISNR